MVATKVSAVLSCCVWVLIWTGTGPTHTHGAEQDITKGVDKINIGNKVPVPNARILSESRKLAQSMLDEVYASRHADLKKRIYSMSQESLKAIRKQVVDAYKGDGDNRIPGFPERRLQEIDGLASFEMKNALWDSIESAKTYDTIAVMYSEKSNSLGIAGNIHSVDIPDLTDHRLWGEALALHSERFPANGVRLPELYEIRGKDFGLQDSDLLAINKVLETQSSKKNAIKWDEADVFLVYGANPPPESDTELQKTVPDSVEHKKKKKSARNKKTKDSKWDLYRKTATQIHKQLEKAVGELTTFERKRGTKVLTAVEQAKYDSLKERVETLANQESRAWAKNERRPHAEKQLLQMLDSESVFREGNDVAIAPSKPACAKCADGLDNRKIPYPPLDDFGKGAHQNTDPRSNWAPELHIEYKEVDPKKYAEEVRKRKSPRLKTLSCPFVRRRRRSTAGSNSCTFMTSTADDPHKKPAKGKKLSVHVQEINSEQFVKEYKTTRDDKTRKLMADVAGENSHKIKGDSKNVQNVKKLVDYEQMQKHSAKIKLANELINSGDVPGLTSKNGNKYSADELHSNGKLRLSPSKTKFPSLTRAAKAVNKVSGAVGKVLLAKNVIQSIHRGDTTSLAIMSGRIGGEAALEGLGKAAKGFGKFGMKLGSKLNAKFAAKLGIKTAAKYASKGMKFLGKVAGPLGTTVDVGLTFWSMLKAKERYTNPNATRFEQNEAMADVIEGTVDIMVTIVTTFGAAIFPPFAPVFVAVGIIANFLTSFFVTVYKASNHVNMLDSKIPLLDYERKEERTLYMLGRDTSAYLTDLINVKQANNLIVENIISSLNANPDEIGRVVPSRTFRIWGNCQLSRTHCAWDTWFGCAKIEKPYAIGWDCLGDGGSCVDGEDNTTKCESSSRIEVSSSLLGYDWQECLCNSSDPVTELGNPHRDSYVDLRTIQTVYFDRSAPDTPPNLQYEYLCKPSSVEFLSDRISVQNSEPAHLCEHAMGIVRRNSSLGKYMVFAMEEGNDTVYVNQDRENDNVFSVGDGEKHFVGGQSSDIFAISGLCTELEGVLDGAGSSPINGKLNMLMIGEDCEPGEELHVDLENSRLFSSPNGSVNVLVKNIQAVYGRESNGESIMCGCTTVRVDGRGGSSADDLDYISVSSQNCVYNLTIDTAPYTSVQLGFTEGVVLINVPNPSPGLKFVHTTSEGLARTAYILRTNCVELINATYARDTKKDVVDQPKSETHIALHFANGQHLDFNIHKTGEQKSLFPSIKLVGDELKDNPTACSLTLDMGNIVALSRLENQNQNQTMPQKHFGALGVKNIFFWTGGAWHIRGGEMDDDFVLQNFLGLQGSVDGGPGGVNSLRLDSSVPDQIVHVDLVRGVAFVDGAGGKPRISITQIQRLFGRVNATDVITASCSASHIDAGGGRTITSPDQILLEDNQGGAAKNAGPGDVVHHLVIIATGHVAIKSHVRECPQVFLIPSSTNGIVDLNFSRSGESSSVIHVQFPMSNLTSWMFSVENDAKVTEAERRTLALNKLSQRVIVRAPSTQWPQISVEFVESDGDPSRLVLTEDGQLFALHALRNDKQNPSRFRKRAGVHGMPTIFHLISGRWDVIGADNASNTFVLQARHFMGNIWGGDGSRNILVIGKDAAPASVAVNVDLKRNKVQIMLDTNAHVIMVDNVTEIEGRPGAPDHITTTCLTIRVDGHGGASEEAPDVIYIHPEAEEHKRVCTSVERRRLFISVHNYTQVNNFAVDGEFVYTVMQDDHFNITVVPNRKSRARHIYQFKLDLNSIKALQFDSAGSILSLQLASGKILEFTMTDPIAPPTEFGEPEYTNPVVQFLPPSQSLRGVEANVRVTADTGHVYCAIKIGPNTPNGVTVNGILGTENKFDISTGANVTLAAVYGSNQDDSFWISSMQAVQVLDGGGSLHGNELHLMNTLWPEQALIVDLNLTHGSIYYNSTRKPLIVTLKRIHSFHGRSNAYEIVKPGCDTRAISNADEIWFNDHKCTAPNYDLTIQIGSSTVVDFSLLDAGPNEEYVPGARFVYRFGLIRSFNIYTDLWSRIRRSRHVFQLAFKISDLDEIWFEKEGSVAELWYTIGNESFVHGVDPYLALEHQYYAQPQFLTADGMQIQIARDSSIFLSTVFNKSGGAVLGVQRDFVPWCIALAKRLGTTVMVSTPADFIYVGYTAHEEDMTAAGRAQIHISEDVEYDGGDDVPSAPALEPCIPSPNLLVNVEGRISHLAGGGGGCTTNVDINGAAETEIRTMYSILSLAHDVYIYPIWDGHDEEDVVDRTNHQQLLDLTHIVWEIRNKTGAKYMPTLSEFGDPANGRSSDLVFHMEGYEGVHPGRVVIVGGAHKRVANRIRVLLGSAVMELKPKTGTEEQIWTLTPVPIRIPEGHTYVIHGEDLEYGQEVFMEGDCANDCGQEHDLASTGFQIVSQDTNVMLTNLEGQMRLSQPNNVGISNTRTESDRVEKVDRISSLLFHDFYGTKHDNRSKRNAASARGMDPKQNVVIHLPNDVKLRLNFSESSVHLLNERGDETVINPTRDWNKLLETVENQLLQDMPEIVRLYTKPEPAPVPVAVSPTGFNSYPPPHPALYPAPYPGPHPALYGAYYPFYSAGPYSAPYYPILEPDDFWDPFIHEIDHIYSMRRK